MKLSEFDLAWYRQWATHHPFLEEWSRPGLTNFLGSLQTGNDVSSLRHPVFPPVSGCEESTAYLTVNGTFLPATRLETEIRWTPWALERQVEAEGLEITTVTAMPWDAPGAVMEIRLKALVAGEHRVALRTSGRCVNRGVKGWFWGIPQVGLTVTDLHDQGGMNPLIEDTSPGLRIWQERPNAQTAPECGRAWCGQAVTPAPHKRERNDDWSWTFSLRKGEEAVLHYALVMGPTREEAQRAEALAANAAQAIVDTEAAWRDLWRQVFAGGSIFSGRLPDLDLPEELLPVAASSILSSLLLRRTHAPNDGRVRYSISMPRRVEACFYTNDWGLAAGVLARLDPEPTWEQLEIALTADIRRFNQINTLTGQGGDVTGHGWPYTVDIFNAFHVAKRLIEQSGDTSLLDREIQTAQGTRSLLATLEDLAFDYRSRKIPSLGLADYGSRQLLLECVSTYEHVVASLNAAAVWMLRELAVLYRAIGRPGDASPLEAEADALQAAILQHLYVDGCGWFRSIAADGSARECRHCWDTGMVLWCIGTHLPEKVTEEMIAFFACELRTPGWIRALSPHDADAAVSGVRADHQYNGAFGAWPAQVALGLIRCGRRDLATDWLHGIARTARQGPFGQAHADENVVPPVNGGAAKITDELPQCCHWCNISGSLFFDVMEAWAEGG